MRVFAKRRILLFCAVVFWCWPAMAQYPETDCDPATWPLSASPAGLEAWCDSKPPGTTCDLAIASSDIRMGDSATAGVEKPRFFVDSANNRFYTRLYVRIENDGDGPAPADHASVPVPDQVTVDFFVKEGDTPADPSDPLFVPAGTMVGTMQSSYAMRIPAPAVGALGSGEFHIQEIPVCWSLTPANFTLPEKFTIKAVLRWGDPMDPTDEDLSDNVAVRFFDLTSTVSRRAQIGMAIDLSGSMAGAKLTQALNRASMYAFLVENGDQLGVWGFATGLPAGDKDSFSSTYTRIASEGGGLVSVTKDDVKEIFPMQTITGSGPQNAALAGIMGQGSYGCTPVGQGLLRARQAILDAPPPAGGSGPAARAIVIFSDGMQNVRPYVNEIDDVCFFNPGTGDTINGLATFGGDDITIYSVFFGPSSLYGWNTMWDIQNQTNGDFFISTVTDLQLAAAYYSIRALVDDMVYFEEKGSTTFSSPSRFEVEFDSAATQATVALAWPVESTTARNRTRLQVWCRPKGVGEDFARCAPVDSEVPPVTDSFASINTATPSHDFFEVFRFSPGAHPTWEFEVRKVAPQDSQPTEYAAAVFTPVNEAQIFPSLDTAGFETGRSLPIFAELISTGVGLTGADVQASVRVPARAVANSLRRYSGQYQKPPDDDNKGNVMMAQLANFLRADEGSEDIYVYRDVPVTLRDDGSGNDRVAGDGIYSGALPASETTTAGDYQVTITARATLDSGRTVERVARLSAICNVGAPDPDRTDVRIVVNPDPVGTVQLATVTVLWADKFGNAAFPNSGSQIAITPINATLKGSLLDNLDSTFSQTITFTPGTQPQVKVAVRDELQGTFGGPGQQLNYRRAWSLHLGQAIPHGTFGQVFDSGLSIGIDWAYRFDANLAVRAELVRDEFDFKFAPGSEELLNLSIYGQYRRSVGPWSPYFEAGLGVYDFDSGGSALGFAIGAGAMRDLPNPRWSLDINAQSHRVGGSFDVGFSRVRLGLIYKY